MIARHKWNLLLALAIGGTALGWVLYFGSLQDDLDDICSIAARWELDESTAPDQRVALMAAQIGELNLGKSASEIFQAVASAAPDQKYGLIVSSAQAMGVADYQCPPLRRLLNGLPPGSAAHDYQLLCDLGLELRATPGLEPLQREQRLLQQFAMESRVEAMQEALELPADQRQSALMALVETETGHAPPTCGLDLVWGNK